MGNRKLGRATDLRMAILRNQATALLWNGRIETTETRAKEVRCIAERVLTIAIKEYMNTTTVSKDIPNDKGVVVPTEVTNDLPSRLVARRRIMQMLYDVTDKRKEKENNTDYRQRTKDIKHPVVEKIFRELAPKYDARAKEKGIYGGYTRIIKKGPRRGDAAEMVLLELV